MCDAGFGASTGYMYDSRGDWPVQIDAAVKVSSQAIELSALSADELPGLVGYLEGAGRPDFDYVSVHGPAKGWVRTSAELAIELRDAIPGFIDAVVLHPDGLSQPDAFAVLGDQVILENMDAFKSTARTVEELLPYFELLPDAGFCFDIAHAHMKDPSMRLADDLLDAFGDRLREVHLSSITDEGRHIPLRPEDIEPFSSVLARCREVPWVLEAPLPADQKIP
jgi:sugar phosphate isomerase/epimerase